MHGVRDELDAALRVEILRRPNQAEIAVADQVSQWGTGRRVLLGDRDHEAKIVAHECVGRLQVLLVTDASSQCLLLVAGERPPAIELGQY